MDNIIISVAILIAILSLIVAFIMLYRWKSLSDSIVDDEEVTEYRTNIVSTVLRYVLLNMRSLSSKDAFTINTPGDNYYIDLPIDEYSKLQILIRWNKKDIIFTYICNVPDESCKYSRMRLTFKNEVPNYGKIGQWATKLRKKGLMLSSSKFLDTTNELIEQFIEETQDDDVAKNDLFRSVVLRQYNLFLDKHRRPVDTMEYIKLAASVYYLFPEEMRAYLKKTDATNNFPFAAEKDRQEEEEDV